LVWFGLVWLGLAWFAFVFFETDSHYVSQAGLKLPILHLPNAGIIEVYNRTWKTRIFLMVK
jgi:hypothetical protein